MVIRMEGGDGEVGPIGCQLHSEVGLQLLQGHGVELDGSILLAERRRLPGQCDGGGRLLGNCQVLRRTGWGCMDRERGDGCCA